ncbi:MAG TPA: hypothetical protein VGJ19_04515 [Streptosporangiaceae bacterium]
MINESSPAALPPGIPGPLLTGCFMDLLADIITPADRGLVSRFAPAVTALLAGAPQASFARQPGNSLATSARGGARG